MSSLKYLLTSSLITSSLSIVPKTTSLMNFLNLCFGKVKFSSLLNYLNLSKLTFISIYNFLGKKVLSAKNTHIVDVKELLNGVISLEF